MELIQGYLSTGGHPVNRFIEMCEEPGWVTWKDFIASEEDISWVVCTRRGGKTRAAVNKAIYSNRNVYIVAGDNVEHVHNVVQGTLFRCDIDYEGQRFGRSSTRVSYEGKDINVVSSLEAMDIKRMEGYLFIFDDPESHGTYIARKHVERILNEGKNNKVAMVGSYDSTRDTVFKSTRAYAGYVEVRSAVDYQKLHTLASSKGEFYRNLMYECDLEAAKEIEFKESKPRMAFPGIRVEPEMAQDDMWDITRHVTQAAARQFTEAADREILNQFNRHGDSVFQRDIPFGATPVQGFDPSPYTDQIRVPEAIPLEPVVDPRNFYSIGATNLEETRRQFNMGAAAEFRSEIMGSFGQHHEVTGYDVIVRDTGVYYNGQRCIIGEIPLGLAIYNHDMTQMLAQTTNPLVIDRINEKLNRLRRDFT